MINILGKSNNICNIKFLVYIATHILDIYKNICNFRSLIYILVYIFD